MSRNPSAELLLLIAAALVWPLAFGFASGALQVPPRPAFRLVAPLPPDFEPVAALDLDGDGCEDVLLVPQEDWREILEDRPRRVWVAAGSPEGLREPVRLRAWLGERGLSGEVPWSSAELAVVDLCFEWEVFLVLREDADDWWLEDSGPWSNLAEEEILRYGERAMRFDLAHAAVRSDARDLGEYVDRVDAQGFGSILEAVCWKDGPRVAVQAYLQSDGGCIMWVEGIECRVAGGGITRREFVNFFPRMPADIDGDGVTEWIATRRTERRQPPEHFVTRLRAL